MSDRYCFLVCLIMFMQCKVLITLGTESVATKTQAEMSTIGLIKEGYETRNNHVMTSGHKDASKGSISNNVWSRFKRDTKLKRNTTEVSRVEIRTHIIWRPKDDDNEDFNVGASKLVILPLVTLLAFIAATCIKISHWWNEDIREADGMLENVYSAKDPHQRVLARVMSTERSPECPNHTSYKKHKYILKKYNRKSRVVPEEFHSVAIKGARSENNNDETLAVVYVSEITDTSERPTKSVCSKDDVDIFLGEVKGKEDTSLTRQQESFVSLGSRTELVPLLDMDSFERKTVNRQVIKSTDVSFPPLDIQMPKGHRMQQKSQLEKKMVQQNKNRKSLGKKEVGLKRKKPQGVSKLVLDSLSFNLNLMKMAMEEDLAKSLSRSGDKQTGRTMSSSSEQSCCENQDVYALEHGYIEDCFIHPGECHNSRSRPAQIPDNESGSIESPSTDNTTLSSPAHSLPWSPGCSQTLSRQESNNAFITNAFLESITKHKPSVSSFSSIATSLTSLSTTTSQLGDSRVFYQIANTSPISSPEHEKSSLRKCHTTTEIIEEDEGEFDSKERNISESGQKRLAGFQKKDSCGDRPVFFLV